MGDQDILERLERELLISQWNRAQVILWLKRSTKYFPRIETMLQQSDMPDDLKYVAVAESDLLAHAGSSKGAVGFWQFLKYTGRKHGLVIDKCIDERRNLTDSTHAAIRFLKELHNALGSWTLAVAAYNMGEEGLKTEILEQEINDYYRLHLPLETQRYVFRILSIKTIFSDPGRYGFHLTKEDCYPSEEYEEVEIRCSGEIPIRVIAQAANTHFKMIKSLNPEIRRHYLPRGTRKIHIPPGSSQGFQERYQCLAADHLAAKKKRTYVVKRGDSLYSIAQQFQVPLPALLMWNHLDPKRSIHPGKRLIIHPNNTEVDNGDADVEKREPK